MLITVQWEWLLATIIFTNKLLTSRLERSSHKTETNNDLLINIETVTRNAQSGTRNTERETRNTKLCILKNIIFILLESVESE